MTNAQTREDIKPGIKVDIVLKADQSTGQLTRGIVSEILTSSGFHHRGIKVKLTDGQVGRVQNIVLESAPVAAKPSEVDDLDPIT